MKNHQFSIFSILLLCCAGCFVMENTFSTIAPGTWRGVLQLVPKQQVDNKKGEPLAELVDLKMEEITEGELPFTFEVTYVNETDFYIEIINGAERLKLDEIKTGRDKKTGNDTIFIDIPEYDSYIRADYDAGVMAGNFYVPSRGDNYKIPFIARYGQGHRFTLLKKEPITDLTGKWEVTFGLDGDDPYPAIGEFKQDGNHVTGTFRTETGDYRFLEGTIQENKIYLSTFDGSHAFLFEAKALDKDHLIGSFRSGTHYRDTWEAKRNPDVTLADPNELTFLNEGFDKIAFSFKNPEGKTISLDNPEYAGKIKLVQIFGTWCPNCRDETEFLTDYLKNNPNEDLAVVALAFEKYKDPARANHALKRYRDKMNVPYEMVVAGSSNKKEAAQALPMLNHILSYPTMIFIDRNNQVRRIHTGFNGPATSKYTQFKEEFGTFVQTLLAEK